MIIRFAVLCGVLLFSGLLFWAGWIFPVVVTIAAISLFGFFTVEYLKGLKKVDSKKELFELKVVLSDTNLLTKLATLKKGKYVFAPTPKKPIIDRKGYSEYAKKIDMITLLQRHGDYDCFPAMIVIKRRN